MTTITFKQRNTTPELLRAGCSSLAIPDPNFAGIHGAQVDGSTGTTQYTRTITGSETGAASEIMLAGWLVYPYGQYGDTFEAGDWICRLNVSQRNGLVVWSSVYICVELTGTGWVTVASNTDVGILLDSTGTKVVTLTTTSPTDISSDASPFLYWFYGFEKVNSAEQTFKYRSNKNLATPIVAKVAMPTATFGAAGIAPAATATGSAAVSVPTASLAAAGAAPATGHTIAVPTVSFSSAGVAPAAAGTGSASVAVPTTLLASSGVAPAATPQTLTRSVPLTTFGTAGVAPTATPQTLTRSVPVATFSTAVVAPAQWAISRGKAPPRFRITSSGIEIGAGVVSTSAATLGVSSALGVGASSSSSLAAARYPWSGQVLGATPCGALAAGRTFSTQQRLSTPVGSVPVSSRLVDSCLERGGSRISGVVAAASPMSGVMAYAD